MEHVNKPSKSDSNGAEFFDFSFRPPPAAEEIYATDELFFRGRLLSSKPTTPPPPAKAVRRSKVSPLSHRRGESLDSHDRRRCSKARAVDYTRLKRASSESTAEATAGKPPRWLLCVLGVVKFPAEMEMKDIKTRQSRLGPSPLMPDNGRRRLISWCILQSLSCKATESTAVAPLSAAL